MTALPQRFLNGYQLKMKSVVSYYILLPAWDSTE